MYKPLFILFVLLQSAASFAQCDCEKQFLFIKHEIETNYAGYKDKTNGSIRKEYDALTSKHLAMAKHTQKDAYCLALMKDWLRFFKDGHVQLYVSDPADVKHDDTAGIYARAHTAEIINIPAQKLEQLRHMDSTEEGIYVSLTDSTYTVAIVKSKNEFRDFAGVVLTSKTPFWTRGQVKLEIKKPTDGSMIYPAIQYDRFHNYSLRRFTFGGLWFDGQAWVKLGFVPGWMKEKKESVSSTQILQKYYLQTLMKWTL